MIFVKSANRNDQRLTRPASRTAQGSRHNLVSHIYTASYLYRARVGEPAPKYWDEAMTDSPDLTAIAARVEEARSLKVRDPLGLIYVLLQELASDAALVPGLVRERDAAINQVRENIAAIDEAKTFIIKQRDNAAEWKAEAEQAKERADSLASRLAQVEAALRPFADAAESYESFDGQHDFFNEDVVSSHIGSRITVGDLRQARAALRPDAKSEDGG
jgi:hypothetical protein